MVSALLNPPPLMRHVYGYAAGLSESSESSESSRFHQLLTHRTPARHTNCVHVVWYREKWPDGRAIFCEDYYANAEATWHRPVDASRPVGLGRRVDAPDLYAAARRDSRWSAARGRPAAAQPRPGARSRRGPADG